MSEISSYIQNWYQTQEGRYTLGVLEAEIQKQLNEIFGYYALEFGIHTEFQTLLSESRVANNFQICTLQSGIDCKGDIIAEPEFLPIVADNIDLVIASHVFEYSAYSRQVLREIDRVLVPEGHCLLVGFNPWSITGLIKRFRSFKSEDDQKLSLRSMGKVKDWFKVLGFEIVSSHTFAFRPPIQHKKIFDHLIWMEKFGGRFTKNLGAVYLIHAKKTEFAKMPPTPWKTHKILAPKPVITASKEGDTL